jgi:hypothetical protein
MIHYTSIVQLGGWHNNESSLSNDNGFMKIDNQPCSAMRQTAPTQQSNLLVDSTLSTINIYDDIWDVALNFGVGYGASAVDLSAGGARGPSLCNDLQQKQSFEWLDDVKGNQDNDAIFLKASHFLSSTSIATSVSEGDGFHRGVLRLRCMILKSNVMITVSSLWLIVI